MIFDTNRNLFFLVSKMAQRAFRYLLPVYAVTFGIDDSVDKHIEKMGFQRNCVLVTCALVSYLSWDMGMHRGSIYI